MGDGNVTVVEYVPQPDIDNDMLIDTTNEEYLYRYTDSQGRMCYVYEEYYPIRLNEVTGLKRSNLVQFRRYDGHGTSNTNYDIFYQAEGQGNLESIKKGGVLDLSDEAYDVIHVFNQVVLVDDGTDGEIQQEVFIENPVELEFGVQETINDDNAIFMTGATGLAPDKAMVIEITLGENNIKDFDFNRRRIDSRFADGGRHKPYVFPLSYDKDEDTVVLYAGPVEDDFVFEITTNGSVDKPWMIMTRAATDAEKGLIQYVDLDDMKESGYMEVTIDVPVTDWFIPVIFQNDTEGAYPALRFRALYPDEVFDLMVVASSEEGRNYSSQDVVSDEIRERDGLLLEYAVGKNTSGLPGEIKIELSTNGFEDIEQSRVTIDMSNLPADKLTDKGTINWNTKIAFTNLVPGNVYGIYFGPNTSTRVPGFLEVEDGFFLFLASRTDKQIDAEDFGVTRECVLKCTSFEPKIGLSSTVSADRSLLKTGKGDLVIDCYKLKIKDPGIYQIVREYSGGSNTDFIIDGDGNVLNRISGYTYELGEGEYAFIQKTVVRDEVIEQKFSLTEIVNISEGEVDVELPGMFFFEGNPDSPLVLEMVNDGAFTTNDLITLFKIEMEDLETGEAFTDFIPFSISQNEVKIYIGAHDGRLLISSDYGVENIGSGLTMQVRPLSFQEDKFINDVTLEINENSEKVEITPDENQMGLIRFEQSIPGPFMISGVKPEQVPAFILYNREYSMITDASFEYHFDHAYGLKAFYVIGLPQDFDPMTITIDKQ